MTTQKARSGCLFGVLASLLILVLLVGGGWWYWRSLYPPILDEPVSPVLAFILSPSNGDEFVAGDPIAVNVQSVAPMAVWSVELFVDGQSLGVESQSPESASWSWTAFPAGIHTLTAKATTSDGQTGQSQTVVFTVLAGDGMMQITANEGQTLPEIGAGFGVPADQMANANPNVDPSMPLQGGQPVQVPIPPGGGGNAGGAGAGSGSESGGGQSQSDFGPLVPILIHWQFTPSEPVDKSYCYTSKGDGNWEKMPKNPFVFFEGAQVNYPQYDFELLGDEEVGIQVQCWGWLGDALKFLGKGEGKYSANQPAGLVMVSGAGFQLVGMPDPPSIPVVPFTGGGGEFIPPPFAVREPADTSDCTKHFSNLLAAFVCDTLLNAQVKQFQVVEWEWQPQFCWPGQDCSGNQINGFLVYEFDPVQKAEKYLKKVPPNQKVTAIPLGWGYTCYGVRAYKETQGFTATSQLATYCPGNPPKSEKKVFSPSNWVTTGGQWIQDGDCDTYGEADAYLLANQNNSFGSNAGEVLVGSYIVDNDDNDCFKQGDYSGGVKFNPALPPGAVFQQALLKYTIQKTDFKATGLATNYKPACVGGVGKAKQDWTSQVGSNHFVGKNILQSKNYFSPVSSSGLSGSSGIDVSFVVKNWLQNPSQNHGFILTPASAPSPLLDGSGVCESYLKNFQLEIYYFLP